MVAQGIGRQAKDTLPCAKISTVRTKFILLSIPPVYLAPEPVDYLDDDSFHPSNSCVSIPLFAPTAAPSGTGTGAGVVGLVFAPGAP